jgi:hypothetical protein
LPLQASRAGRGGRPRPKNRANCPGKKYFGQKAWRVGKSRRRPAFLLAFADTPNAHQINHLKNAPRRGVGKRQHFDVAAQTANLR